MNMALHENDTRVAFGLGVRHVGGYYVRYAVGTASGYLRIESNELNRIYNLMMMMVMIISGVMSDEMQDAGCRMQDAD